MKANYLLIDYENVQPKSLSALPGHPFKVIVFVGASQNKISVEFASGLQALGGNAEYVRVSGNGSNALDFHIAFTVGELSKSDPSAHFHIISKDSGFDPLIDYLRKRGIFAQRSAMIADLLTPKKPNTKAVPDRLETIIQNLASRKAGKPRSVKTLSNTINALFGKSLAEAEVANFIKALKKRGHISVDGESVTYHL